MDGGALFRRAWPDRRERMARSGVRQASRVLFLRSAVVQHADQFHGGNHVLRSACLLFGGARLADPARVSWIRLRCGARLSRPALAWAVGIRAAEGPDVGVPGDSGAEFLAGALRSVAE